MDHKMFFMSTIFCANAYFLRYKDNVDPKIRNKCESECALSVSNKLFLYLKN